MELKISHGLILFGGGGGASAPSTSTPVELVIGNLHWIFRWNNVNNDIYQSNYDTEKHVEHVKILKRE